MIIPSKFNSSLSKLYKYPWKCKNLSKKIFKQSPPASSFERPDQNSSNANLNLNKQKTAN